MSNNISSGPNDPLEQLDLLNSIFNPIPGGSSQSSSSNSSSVSSSPSQTELQQVQQNDQQLQILQGEILAAQIKAQNEAQAAGGSDPTKFSRGMRDFVNKPNRI